MEERICIVCKKPLDDDAIESGEQMHLSCAMSASEYNEFIGNDPSNRDQEENDT